MITLEQACEIFRDKSKARWIHSIHETEHYWTFTPWVPPLPPGVDPMFRYMFGVSTEAISKDDGRYFWVEIPDMPPSKPCEIPAKYVAPPEMEPKTPLEKLHEEYEEFKQWAREHPEEKEDIEKDEIYFKWLFDHPEHLTPDMDFYEDKWMC